MTDVAIFTFNEQYSQQTQRNWLNMFEEHEKQDDEMLVIKERESF